MGSSSRGPTPSADDTWELVFRLSWMMREHFLSTARVFDLSPPQAGALQQLDPDTPVPMGELAVALHCDASTVTGLVDRLESRGLVERKASPRDRLVKARSEEHTSELQSRPHLVCRLLLEKKKRLSFAVFVLLKKKKIKHKI